jgi:putative two-component system response regulator
MTKTIFVVDDNDTNLSIVKEALQEQYRVMTLPSAAKMFAMLAKLTPDLILLDIEMPETDGFEALGRLKGNELYADIPVIFLTGMTDEEVEARGFEMGVVDFIAKPFSVPVLRNRLKFHLNIDKIIKERTSQVFKLKNGIISVLADMVENRDEGTGGHITRTSAYINILIAELQRRGLYTDELSGVNLETFVTSTRLHDIGKITIPDTILNKPGRLTDDEFDEMKKHTAEGGRIIDQIVMQTENGEFLHNAKLFAETHHERWDGKGYPYGLEQNEIPIQGRIMAIADVYDALVSERPYKKAFSTDEAVRIIMEGAGTQFDPEIAGVFYDVREQFAAVKARVES